MLDAGRFAETTNHLWYWDFTDSCKDGSEYLYTVPGRQDMQSYHYQICGTSTTTCPGNVFPQGSVIQTWQSGGNILCETLGEGAPLFTPWDNGDSAPNGINITYMGTPNWSGE